MKSLSLILLLFSTTLIYGETFKVFYYDTDSNKEPIRVVGDMDYAPIEWLEAGEAKGIIPGLLPVLADYLERDIEYKLMDWKEAQKSVLQGRADVLTVFSPNDKRVKDYDFVDGILNFEMSLFVPSDNITIHNISDIDDKKIGVTKGGILGDFLEKNSSAKLVTIENHLTGFNQLLNGELDAVATTKWVGAYNIQQHRLKGIKYVDQPLLIKPTHLGIKKGNIELQNELDSAIDKMKSDGAIKELTRDWESLEIVYLTQSSIRKLTIIIVIVLVTIILGFFISYIIILKKQVEKRTQKLEKTQDKLIQAQKIASLSSVVTGIAHEINTPLGISITALSNILDLSKHLLVKELSIDDFIKEHSKSLALLNSNLNKISKKIETFKQIAGNHIVAEREEFLIEDIIRSAVNDARMIINKIDIEYEIKGGRGLKINSYSSALLEIINHLIFNSYTHAFNGVENPQISIELKEKTDNVEIIFSDNGNGIPDKNILKIFDPFYTTQLNRGSSGLGLNMIYTIVTGLLGGEINVRSTIGTTFKIKLPKESPELKTQ